MREVSVQRCTKDLDQFGADLSASVCDKHFMQAMPRDIQLTFRYHDRVEVLNDYCSQILWNEIDKVSGIN